jgi:hypothetical protein
MIKDSPNVFVDRPDPGPPPVPKIDDSKRCEGPERLAHDGARHPELYCEAGF